MTDKMKSFVMGILVGLAGKPLEFSPGASDPDREPVAYLYNGVRFPKIPESEKPYAVIEPYEPDPVLHYCSALPKVSNGKMVWDDSCEIEMYTYSAYRDEWSYFDTVKRTEIAVPYGLLWSNEDLFADNGKLYLAESDPVPVYE